MPVLELLFAMSGTRAAETAVTPGIAAEPREHLLEQLLRTRHGVAVALRSQTERDDVIDRDAEIDAADVEQALAEESRAGEQAHRECNLRDDERRPEVAPPRARPTAVRPAL